MACKTQENLKKFASAAGNLNLTPSDASMLASIAACIKIIRTNEVLENSWKKIIDDKASNQNVKNVAYGIIDNHQPTNKHEIEMFDYMKSYIKQIENKRRKIYK